MKLAYFVHPHLGGTYTLYKHLRMGLMAYDIDVHWVALGTGSPGTSVPAGSDVEPGFVVHLQPSDSEAESAARLIGALEEHGFDGVFINVLADRLQMNVAGYLPARMLRIIIVHNITPGTYAAARAIRDNVHATVGVSERCRRDLVQRFGFSPEWTVAIPNAVDTAAFRRVERTPKPTDRTRLLFLGRIEDAPKGVFWLPAIMDRLPESISLTVAGDGPDLARLTERLARHAARVRFTGAVDGEEVPALAAAHDILIVPSRFEGFGFSIIEGMAAGCVPVVSRISGVTDMIVEDGASGFLFPVGDWAEAARRIEELHRRPMTLARMSLNARRRAESGFDIETMSAAYHSLIERLHREGPTLPPALPIDAWSVPAGLRAGFRTYLPRPVNNWLRVVKERI